ncbi:MAG: beta-phosphoglucomutase [Flavobacteriales bacterium]|nr:beta-phosphoglucomutase [Flavobacteriales bacterium]
MTKPACIFDLDGVLVDTAVFHFKAWKKIARKLGFELSSLQNEMLKGISRRESLEIIVRLSGTKINADEKELLLEEKNQNYLYLIKDLQPSDLLPGAGELLQQLSLNQHKIGLGSASKNANSILIKLGIHSIFDAIIDGSKTSAGKPNPEVFLKAAEEMSEPPGNCVVFEDAAAGIEAAKKAGMYAIGIGQTQNLPNADLILPDLKNFTYQNFMNLKFDLNSLIENQ